VTATAVDYHPTGWSPCTSAPRGMDRDVLESSPCTLSGETFIPRVLGSNPSRLTSLPRSNRLPKAPGWAVRRAFDSHGDSHGKRTGWDVVEAVEDGWSCLTIHHRRVALVNRYPTSYHVR